MIKNCYLQIKAYLCQHHILLFYGLRNNILHKSGMLYRTIIQLSNELYI